MGVGAGGAAGSGRGEVETRGAGRGSGRWLCATGRRFAVRTEDIARGAGVFWPGVV